MTTAGADTENVPTPAVRPAASKFEVMDRVEICLVRAFKELLEESIHLSPIDGRARQKSGTVGPHVVSTRSLLDLTLSFLWEDELRFTYASGLENASKGSSATVTPENSPPLRGLSGPMLEPGLVALNPLREEFLERTLRQLQFSSFAEAAAELTLWLCVSEDKKTCTHVLAEEELSMTSGQLEKYLRSRRSHCRLIQDWIFKDLEKRLRTSNMSPPSSVN